MNVLLVDDQELIRVGLQRILASEDDLDVVGEAGDDEIYGDEGRDTLRGGNGDDSLYANGGSVADPNEKNNQTTQMQKHKGHRSLPVHLLR